jgi:hypothetical protein
MAQTPQQELYGKAHEMKILLASSLSYSEVGPQVGNLLVIYDFVKSVFQT